MAFHIPHVQIMGKNHCGDSRRTAFLNSCFTQRCENLLWYQPIPRITILWFTKNPHGARGLGKHYHICFDPNIGHVICEIIRIPCACVSSTSMLDQPWISGLQQKKQAHYQPVTNCTYWPVLSPYKNCNIIHPTPK